MREPLWFCVAAFMGLYTLMARWPGRGSEPAAELEELDLAVEGCRSLV